MDIGQEVKITYNPNKKHIQTNKNPYNRMKTKFILDTGATSYIITNIRSFSTFHHYKKPISQGQAYTRYVKGYRDIYIKFPDINLQFLLKNYYYIPKLRVNLIL